MGEIKDYFLDGIHVFNLQVIPDERGFFAEALRLDWKNLLDNDQIVQVNISYSYPGVVRAWHKHERGQVDYFLVVKGAMKICAYDEKTRKMVELIGSENKPCIIRIPGKYWHGTKTISNEPSTTIYFTTKLYDYNNPDELRKPWNDPSIVPVEINGKKYDPRCNKPWDWNYPPHK